MKHLKVGDAAPNFKAAIETGEIVELADYSDKKLVLYFYPKDATPGCTTQGCNLRDHYAELREKGYEILGVSPDSAAKHVKFIDKHEFPFHLLVDEDREIIEAYGVWGPKKFMGREYDGLHRTTFIIEHSKIVGIIEKVKTKDHAQQILDLMEGK